jgi:UDP-N-acetylglucosamine 4,6-dehydratase/5-epimerase
MQKNSYLITGGTGSFGSNFIEKLIKSNKKISKLVIFSRDELKQSIMASKYPLKKFKFIRFFLGDVRDYERLLTATKDIENIIHAAALKQVPSAEYNPFEAIKTNIIGAQNVISAALENGTKNVIALSTDKACAPINLYGATKLCSDKLFIAANNIKGKKNIKFSVVRYGNVFGSRGSVYPVFKNFVNKGYFPITDKNMTRFNITIEEGINLVIKTLKTAVGGEIIIPKLKSFKVVDLAKALNEKNTHKIIGIRSGEKIHEQMITKSDSYDTLEIKNSFILLPPKILDEENYFNVLNYYKKKFKAKKVKNGFEYSSDQNGKYLTIKEIKKLISTYKFKNL